MPEIKDDWVIGTSEHQGKPMIIRRNFGVKKIKGKGYFNLCSGISFKLLIQTQNGLQSKEENEYLNTLENKIFEYFDNNKNFVVTVILSTSGFKEYIIYHNEECNFIQHFNNL